MDCRSQLSRFRCLVIERHQLYAHFIRRAIYNLELSGPLEELSDVKKEIAIIEADYNAARSSANHNMTINKRNLSPQNPQRISTRTQYAA
ncbi:hypothetical protein D3C79_86810 [compost metagenome]